MGRQHLRNNVLSVKQQKTGTQLDIDLHPELIAILEATPSNMTFLTTEKGKPFSPAGFTNWFSDAVTAAGLPKGLAPHGLRKGACRRLAEAGCTAHQIMAITGHKSLSEVERYTKAVDQKRLARTAIKMMHKRIKETGK